VLVDGWSLVRFLHVTAAIIWVGGQLTLAIVVVPVVARQLAGSERSALMTATGRRFALVSMAGAIPVAIITGVALMVQRSVDAQMLTATAWGQTLLAKLGLVVVAIGLAGLHGVLAGAARPKAARVMSISGTVASLAIVLLATSLVP
jgi:putative copper export protein